MSSAMAYEPDDFDNNPFAEHDQVLSEQHNEPITVQIAPDESQVLAGQEEQEDAHNDEEDYEQEQEVPADYPNEEEIKMYLPERYNQSKFKIAIKVTEIEDSGKQTSYNPTIKLASRVAGLRGFRKETYKDFRRSYREIESFAKFLIYNNVEVFVPSLPPLSSTYNIMSPDWVRCLQSSLQMWFNRVCNNPLLIKNPEFTLFFEQPDFAYVPSKTKPAYSSIIPTGIKRKTIKQFHPPPDSCEKLAKFRPLIKEIYLVSNKIVEKLERLLKLDRQSAFYVNDFITNLNIMGNLDPSEEMVKLWNKFQKIICLFTERELVNNISCSSALLDYFQLLALDCYNIKESLTNRHLLMKELLNAEDSTKRKKLTIDKLKLKSTIDTIRIEEAIYGLEQANLYEKEIRYRVNRVTFEMILESDEVMSHFTQKLIQLLSFITQQRIKQERKKLTLLVNNKVINPKDSLAKLGREDQQWDNASSYTTNTNTTADSWSSRPRKNYDPLPKEEDNKDSTNDGDFGKFDAKQAAALLSAATFN